MTAAVQMLVGLGVPAAMIVALSWLRLMERLRLLDVVRVAAEAQQPMTAEAIAALTGRFFAAPPHERDRRRGVMMISVGVAIAVFGGVLALTGLLTAGFHDATPVGVVLAGLGAIPAALGAGYVVLSHRESVDA